MRGPVVVTVERALALPGATLWARQSAVQRWTTWHPDVSWVAPGAALAPGGEFEWVWRGTRLRSRITGYREGTLLVWATESPSGNSTMRWTFTTKGGTTLVVARAALDAGHVLSRRPAGARAGLERALERWIDALAHEPRYAVPA